MAERRKGFLDPGKSASGTSVGSAVDSHDRQVIEQIHQVIDAFLVHLEPGLSRLSRLLSHDPSVDRIGQLSSICHQAFVQYVLDGVTDSALDAAMGSALEEHLRASNISAIEVRDCMAIVPEHGSAASEAIRAVLGLVNTLVVKHERKAAAVAKLFWTKSLGKDELRQLASIAFRKAVLTFDPSKGATLATWAHKIIHNHLASCIAAALGNAEYSGRQIEEFMEARARLTKAGAPRPTNQEVFDFLKWKPTKCKNMIAILRASRTHQLSVLEESVGQLANPDETSDPESTLVLREQLQRLDHQMSQLSQSDAQIVILRNVNNLSFPEISRQLGMDEHVVRRSHNEILPRLRHHVEGLGENGGVHGAKANKPIQERVTTS